MIRLDSSSVWKVQRARQLQVTVLVAFLGGCELADVPATGTELTNFRKCRGNAFAAWREATGGTRRRLRERWRLSASIIARDCLVAAAERAA